MHDGNLCYNVHFVGHVIEFMRPGTVGLAIRTRDTNTWTWTLTRNLLDSDSTRDMQDSDSSKGGLVASLVITPSVVIMGHYIVIHSLFTDNRLGATVDQKMSSRSFDQFRVKGHAGIPNPWGQVHIRLNCSPWHVQIGTFTFALDDVTQARSFITRSAPKPQYSERA